MSDAPTTPVSVLQVLSQDVLGGTELMTASLIERLDPRRVSCELAVLSAAGPITARLRAAGIEVHVLGHGAARGAGRLARLLRRRRFDVVNACGIRGGLVTRFAARAASPRTKVVIGVRSVVLTATDSADSRKAKLAGWLERRTSRLVDLYDSNSHAGAELIASYGIAPERVRYIPNGVDLAPPQADNGSGPADAAAPLIFTAARFAPVKRHQDLLQALALLKADGVRFRAVLAGTGATWQRCRELAAELGLSREVEFPGAIDPDAVASLLGRADVACLPSLWEGMPGFVMEAMAARVPVVATAVSGTEELVVDRETGVLTPVRDPVALKEALSELLANPALGLSMGEAGRARIAGDFSLESMVGSKLALYEELVHG